jgi:hypothetical protein
MRSQQSIAKNESLALNERYHEFVKAVNVGVIRGLLEMRPSQEELDAMLKDVEEMQQRVSTYVVGFAKRKRAHLAPLVAKTVVMEKELAPSVDVPARERVEVVPEKVTSHARPIENQVRELLKYFPSLKAPAQIPATPSLPKGIDGWHAFPRASAISSSYSNACVRVFDVLKNARDCSFISPATQKEGEWLRRATRAREAWKRIEESQSGSDILIVPVQLSLLHKGATITQSRELLELHQFGLGAFEVATVLLLNSGLLAEEGALSIDCIGDDELSIEKKQVSVHIPRFVYRDKGLGFGSDWCGSSVENARYASGVII